MSTAMTRRYMGRDTEGHCRRCGEYVWDETHECPEGFMTCSSCHVQLLRDELGRCKHCIREQAAR
jgi:hypothetical protein